MEKNNNEISKRYLEKVTMFMSGTIAILIMILIGYILHLVIPNELNIQHIKNSYIQDLSFFVAEQSERMQYILLTISFPIIYIFVYKLLQKINKKIPNCKIIYNIFSILNVLVIIGLLFWTGTIDRRNLILGKYISTLQIIISCYIGAMLLLIYRMIGKKKKMKIFLYAITSVIIGMISYLYINPTWGQTGYIAHHADAYYNPILKITSGLTPYIDFTPIYGCYSYVLALIQNLFDNSIMCFSIIQSVLIAILLINLSIIIYKNIKNKALGFITINATIFSMIIYSYTVNKGPYLQFVPHRVLFISIILLFITIYLRYRNTEKKLLLQIIGYFITTCSLFWNIETGLIVLIVWTGFLGYEILFFNSLKNKKTYISILKLLIMSVLSVIMTYFIIFIITYLRTGSIIDIKSLIASQTFFYKDGFNMIKMSLKKPWIVLIYIYLIGLIISLKKLYFMSSEKRILFNRYAIIFVLSILGIGVFSYYQGRSHDSVFVGVIYPGTILIGVFTDILLEKISLVKAKKYQISNMLIVCINIVWLSLLATTTIYSLVTDGTIKLHFNKELLKNVTILEDFSEYDTSNLEFITDNESLYYDKYNIKDTKKIPAKVDLFSYKDCEKIMKFLKETDKDVVIHYKILQILESKYKEDYQSLNDKFTFKTKEKSANIVLINNK